MKDLLLNQQLGDFGMEADTCGICAVRDLEKHMDIVWKPNPYGAWRGVVISHRVCKDKEACVRRRDQANKAPTGAASEPTV